MILKIYDHPSRKRTEQAVDNLNKSLSTVLDAVQTINENTSRPSASSD